MGSSKQLVLAAILTYLALLLPLTGKARADEIRWFTNFDAAMKEAKDKNRPVFLDVYKDRCPPCRYLDETVYQDPAVVKYISENFIALKINGEVESVHIKDGGLIRAFPTLVYLTPDKNVLETQVGALDPSGLLEQAKKAMTAVAALTPTKKPAAPPVPPTPFQGRVRTGPGAGQPNVWTTGRVFPPSSVGFSAQPLNPKDERKQRAREILVQAVDSYRKQQWLTCMDLSRSVMVFYPDLAESTEARQLEQSINTEKLERLEKDLTENLGQLYWELAQTKIRQNQTAQAAAYMEKIVQSCPGTRYFAAAQNFLRNMSRAPAEQHARGSN